MHWLLLILLVLAVVFGPSLWAKAVLAHHADDRPDYPGTGGELARHLLDEAGFDPQEKLRGTTMVPLAHHRRNRIHRQRLSRLASEEAT